MQFGRAKQRRALGAAGVGLASVVWAVTQAARGDWEFYALALVLTVATNLTVVEIAEKRTDSAGPRPGGPI